MPVAPDAGGAAARVDGVDHDNARDSDLKVAVEDAGDFEAEQAAQGPPSEDNVDAVVWVALDGEIFRLRHVFDVLGVEAGHFGDAAGEGAARVEVGVSDAVDEAVQAAEAVVRVDGAAAIVDQEQGCGVAGGRLVV